MEIIKLGDAVLRQKALPVAEVNDEIRAMIDEMFKLMIEAEGVGLAAPQVGKSLRLFVLIADDDVRRVFINPQIIETSQELVPYDEGCLSIPKCYESIMRPKQVTVQALNEWGKPFTLQADGLLARIIQHENDHLEGMLFIDRGDPAFKTKTEIQFAMRQKRAQEKALAKKAKAEKIAAKQARLAAKKAQKTQGDATN